MQQAKDTAEKAFGGRGGISRHHEERGANQGHVGLCQEHAMGRVWKDWRSPRWTCTWPGRLFVMEAERVLALDRETGFNLTFLVPRSAPITPKPFVSTHFIHLLKSHGLISH